MFRRIIAKIIVIFWMSVPLQADPLIGIAFPPVADERQRAFSVAAIGNLGIQHVRVSDRWSLRGLNPKDTDYLPLVRRIAQLRTSGLKVLLTIELSAPDGACGLSNEFACVIASDAPFEAYIEGLLAAVGSDLDAIQIGNEWDNRFPGTAEQFLSIYGRASAVIRSEHPELTLLMGGITANAPFFKVWCVEGLSPNIPDIDLTFIRTEFCERGARRNAEAARAIETVFRNADYDIVDVHLYDAPGLWMHAVGWVSERTQSPIWVTEFGGPHPELEPRNPSYHASRLSRYLEAIDELPVARAYYFKLTDDPKSYHGVSGLYDLHGQPKPALDVFANWMDRR